MKTICKKKKRKKSRDSSHHTLYDIKRRKTKDRYVRLLDIPRKLIDGKKKREVNLGITCTQHAAGCDVISSLAAANCLRVRATRERVDGCATRSRISGLLLVTRSRRDGKISIIVRARETRCQSTGIPCTR